MGKTASQTLKTAQTATVQNGINHDRYGGT